MKCKNCGFELEEGALFCRKCGTAAPKEPESPAKKPLLNRKKLHSRVAPLIALGVLLVLVLIVVIVCAASCSKRTTKYESPDALIDDVVNALETGDGARLYDMTKLSESFLGAHPETFGEGDSPAAVMKGYYTRLADDFCAQMNERFPEGFRLDSRLTAEFRVDSEIYETNRALGLEAETCATVTGPLTVNGETVADLYLVMVQLDGTWQLLVLYLC